MIRKRGYYTYEIMLRMKMSRPTLNKYIDNPELMSGLDRKKIATILSIDIELIDNLCNGRIKHSAEEYSRILDLIVPLKRKKHEIQEQDSD
jgi:DNA-binding CsgD family transcriptional regulator